MISVIILTFNNYDQLLATLHSIDQVSGIFEKIIINGGNCLQTRAYLDHLAKETHNPRYQIIQEKDEGIADGFNKGIKLSKGSFINFLNSGDRLIDPHYYIKAIKVMEENPQIQNVHANIIFDDPNVGKILMPPRLCALAEGMPFQHQTMVVRKILFQKFGLFNKNYRCAMDFEWLCRIHLNKNQSAYLDANAVLMDGDGVSSTREKQSLFECRKALLDNSLWTFGNSLKFYKRATKYFLRQVVFRYLPKCLIKHFKVQRNQKFVKAHKELKENF